MSSCKSGATVNHDFKSGKQPQLQVLRNNGRSPLLRVHLKETDQMDLNDVAKEFVRRIGYFGNF